MADSVLIEPSGPPLVLASASAARAAMLEDAGLRFAVQPAIVDEEEVRGALAAEQVASGDAATILAELKARWVAERVPGDTLVLGADQLLAVDDAGKPRWLAKPATDAGLKAQLRALSGGRHELFSSAVLFRNRARIWHHVGRARLWMRPLSDGFVDSYVAASGAAERACVGGYRIEGLGVQLFSRVEGDQFTIRGLPLLPLLAMLREQGVLPP